MVATSIHYVVGVFLANQLGFKDNKKYWLGLIAILPDLDGILIAFLLLMKNLTGISLSFLESSKTMVMLFAHRGMSHSLFLLLATLLILFAFRIDKKIMTLVGALWFSHLVFDYITAWKLFPFLPFSNISTYFALVEVFDSILVFTSTILLAFFIGESLLKKEKKLPLIIAFFILLIFGFSSSVAMGEFNIQTVILSQLAFWLILILSLKNSNSKNKKSYIKLTRQGVKAVSYIVVIYLSLLIINKVAYAAILKTSPMDVEPLEEFAINFNAHTYEIDKGDIYDMGIISWRGIEKQKQVRKIRNTDNVPQETIKEFLEAYPYSIHINWFNNPVFTFYEDSEGIVYANIRYAKSFIETPYIPGPQQGMNVKLNDAGILVSYDDSWFD